MVLLFLNSEVLWSFFFHLAWLAITGVLCSSTLDIEPSDATKQKEPEAQVHDQQIVSETTVETDAHADVHDESDSEETIETEKFPEYDDPFRRASHPFWSQGWYDIKTGVFMGHDGGRYALRAMWLPGVRRHLRNSPPPGPRRVPQSKVPGASRQHGNTPETKHMRNNTKDDRDMAAILRAWKICMDEQRRLAREAKSHGPRDI
ncbi:hypothetical protein VSDG_08237 [Cytospora chrysosperma]|uniref:Uncharacterized protein n=1 Tax=Cytospora chrysosperma TaxID=252740 RepID=A0A423VG05_CYTCH|nr:hypothetical protein VSDG_08237 [Valsa sordida]